VWLTGVSQPVRRMLEATSLYDLFRIAMTPADAVQLFKQELTRPERRTRPRGVSGAPRTRRPEVEKTTV
jgi:N-acetylglucosaminyldiphosphoundecaprenol N-acetyl-beta-D-mannosaminyltransferase